MAGGLFVRRTDRFSSLSQDAARHRLRMKTLFSSTGAALAFPCLWIRQDAVWHRRRMKTLFSPLPLRSPFTIFVRSLSSFSSGDRGGCTPVGKGTNFAPLLLWPEKKTRKRIAWVAQLDRAAVS